MPLLPLTHHQIIGLIEPFTRRGRHVDLAASDRLERRLAFKPIEHTGEPVALAGLRETLSLENTAADTFRLTRRLATADGLEASLYIEGADPGELLARIEAVPAGRQFLTGAGFAIALSHRLEAGWGGKPMGTGPGAFNGRLTLTHAAGHAGDPGLKMKVPKTRGTPAQLELSVSAEDTIDLPEDLLAVLGWSWGRLIPVRQGWTSNIGLRGGEPERSAEAERKLEKAARHIAQTLAEPPARFHERRVWARWGVAARRASPLIGCAALMAGAAAVQDLELAQNSVFRMLIFHTPPLLLMVFFCLQEMPRVEIPPLPRRSRATAWRPVIGAASAVPEPRPTTQGR
jgi:hypothetical protein